MTVAPMPAASMRAPTDGERLRGLIAAIGCIMVTGMGFGLTFPLLSTLMEREGAGPFLLGANITVAALSTVLVAPIMPAVLRRASAQATLIGALAVSVLSILAFKLFENFWIWILLRFIGGCAITALFVISEVWINQLATDANRGRVVGLYATCLSIGFFGGPMVLKAVGFDGWAPFVAGAALLAAAGAPALLGIGVPFAGPESERLSGLARYVKAAPSAFLAVFLFGGLEATTFHLLTVYGLRVGLTEAAGATLLQGALIGYILFQTPLGALAGRVGPRTLIIVLSGAAAILTAFLPFATDVGVWDAPAWLSVEPTPMVFFWIMFLTGGLTCGLYTCGLVLLGERFKDRDLAGANAAFIFVYGAGSLIAPAAALVSMEIFPPHGYAVFFAGALGGLALFAGVRSRRALDGAANGV